MEHKLVTLADQILEQLEKDILSGKYARDEILNEQRISTELSVSRTPVREALKRLDITRMTFAPWGIITMQTDGHKWIVSQDLYPDKANQARFYLKDYNWIEVPFQLP